MMHRISSLGATDVGMKRSGNEDAFAVINEIGLYLVADGMGGHSSGEVASRIAIEEISKFFVEDTMSEDATWPYVFDDTMSLAANKLRTAIDIANEQIQLYASGHPESRGMGTTIVAALANGNSMVISNVGDSRAYLLKGGVMRQVTTDHSWVAEQIHQGFLSEKEAEKHPFRNVITKALGTKEQALPDILELAITGGERLLLCSDGLNSMVRDKEIKKILSSSGPLEGICRQLIRKANDKGGEDNITVLIIDVD